MRDLQQEIRQTERLTRAIREKEAAMVQAEGRATPPILRLEQQMARLMERLDAAVAENHNLRLQIEALSRPVVAAAPLQLIRGRKKGRPA